MSSYRPASNRIEEVRLRNAYARRREKGRYSLFSDGHLLLLHERERNTLALFKQHGITSIASARILEVGCGTGHWLRDAVRWGARPDHVVGVELLASRAVEARALCPSAVTICSSNAAALPFANGAFDIVVQSTVFTSILDGDIRRRVADEMVRVLKPSGLIVWYDFLVNNPRNPDVRGITRRQIQALFPGCRLDVRRVTLVPPLLRWLAPYSWLAASALGRVPWLCTHYLCTIRRT